MGLASQEGIRLLTLTGPGGTGKTRLAAAAAGELAELYPDGVLWVPLGALRDSELVLATAGQALGARNGLAHHISDRFILILFDNFEQVVEAAPEVAGLLASCPKLDLLVTSREPLHLTGEREYAVPPFVHEEAVGFFLARARAVDPDFQADEAVSEICRRLDELPLALELAAARVKALTSAQILARLAQRLPLLTGGARDVPDREYAAERLDESGEAEEVRRRHTDHFLVRAEEAEPSLIGGSAEWLQRLEREHDNLRAVLDRLEASGQTALAQRLAGVLSRFWYLRGHLVGRSAPSGGCTRRRRASDGGAREGADRSIANSTQHGRYRNGGSEGGRGACAPSAARGVFPTRRSRSPMWSTTNAWRPHRCSGSRRASSTRAGSRRQLRC